MSENTERSKHGWIFWTAVALIVFVGYPLSYGPAWWVAIRCHERYKTYRAFDVHFIVYAPIRWIAEKNQPFARALVRYIQFWDHR